MTTLYIIGNGFDISHGLKTRYSDLKDFVKENDSDTYEQIMNQLFIGKEDLWSVFEESVGIDDTYFLDKFEEASANAYEIGENMDVGGDWQLGDVWSQAENNDIDRAESISSYLVEASKGLNFKDLYSRILQRLSELLLIAEQQKIVSKENLITMFNNDENVKFITFNYTHTLESIYNIKKSDITYIHGEIGNDVLIFGNDEKNICYLNTKQFNKEDSLYVEWMKSDEESIDDTIDSRQYELFNLHAYSAQESPNAVDNSIQVKEYNDSKKEWIKETQIDVFKDKINNLDVDKIIVLGHSLGEVDKEYFEILNKSFPDAAWTLSYYDCSDVVFSNFEKLFSGKVLADFKKIL